MEPYSIDFKSVIKGESRIWNIANDVIVLHLRHLRRILQSYVNYYHTWRTHRSLEGDGCAQTSAGTASRGGARSKAARSWRLASSLQADGGLIGEP